MHIHVYYGLVKSYFIVSQSGFIWPNTELIDIHMDFVLIAYWAKQP